MPDKNDMVKIVSSKAADLRKVRADYALTIPPDILDPDKIGYFFQFASGGLAERSGQIFPIFLRVNTP